MREREREKTERRRMGLRTCALLYVVVFVKYAIIFNGEYLCFVTLAVKSRITKKHEFEFHLSRNNK